MSVAAVDGSQTQLRDQVTVREVETAYDLDRPSASVATPSCCCCCCCCVTALTVVPTAAALDTGERAVAHRRENKRHVVALLTVVSMLASLFAPRLLDTVLGASSSLTERTLVAGLVAVLGMSWARKIAGEALGRSLVWSIAVFAGWCAAMIANVYLVGYGGGGGVVVLELILAPLWIWLLIRRSQRRRDDIRDAIDDADQAAGTTSPPGAAS